MKIEINKNQIILNLETLDVDKILHSKKIDPPIQCVYCRRISIKKDWVIKIFHTVEGPTIILAVCPDCGNQMVVKNPKDENAG